MRIRSTMDVKGRPLAITDGRLRLPEYFADELTTIVDRIARTSAIEHNQLVDDPREAAINDPTPTNKGFHLRSRFCALEVVDCPRDRGEPSRL